MPFEAKCFVKRLNLGLRAFAAGPPSTPNSVNLKKNMLALYHDNIT